MSDRGNEQHWTLTHRCQRFYEIQHSQVVTQAIVDVDDKDVNSITIGGQTIEGPRILRLLRNLLNDLATEGYKL